MKIQLFQTPPSPFTMPNFWLFGILTSKMHIAWVKAVGGRLETRYRYSATLCYNTFPFPKITEAKRTEIEQAAEAVLIAREMHTEKRWHKCTTRTKCPPTSAKPIPTWTAWWKAATARLPSPPTKNGWNTCLPYTKK